MFYVPVHMVVGRGSFQPPSDAEGAEFESSGVDPMSEPGLYAFRGTYKNYTEEALQMAIYLVVNDGMPKRQAARKTGVPLSTIKRKLNRLKTK